MIPALVADEIRDTRLDYLRTNWALSDHGLEQVLFRFLETAMAMRAVSGPLRASIRTA